MSQFERRDWVLFCKFQTKLTRLSSADLISFGFSFKNDPGALVLEKHEQILEHNAMSTNISIDNHLLFLLSLSLYSYSCILSFYFRSFISFSLKSWKMLLFSIYHFLLSPFSFFIFSSFYHFYLFLAGCLFSIYHLYSPFYYLSIGWSPLSRLPSYTTQLVKHVTDTMHLSQHFASLYNKIFE